MRIPLVILKLVIQILAPLRPIRAVCVMINANGKICPVTIPPAVGGGGGHIGDGCGSKTTRYMSADLTQTAYVTVDTCTGERWVSSSSF